MKLISKHEMVSALVDHPYESNPNLVAKVNFFYFSPDKKLAIAYYESPPGWFDVEVKGFSEIDYVLEGEVELISDSSTIRVKAGDSFLIEDGDKLRWKMHTTSKMLFFIYPITEEIDKLIDSFYRESQTSTGASLFVQ